MSIPSGGPIAQPADRHYHPHRTHDLSICEILATALIAVIVLFHLFTNFLNFFYFELPCMHAYRWLHIVYLCLHTLIYIITFPCTRFEKAVIGLQYMSIVCAGYTTAVIKADQ